MAVSAVMSFHGFANGGKLLLLGFILTASVMLLWFKDVIVEVRGMDQLQCSNTSISDGSKMTCLVVDLILPYFIISILAIAGAYMSAKWLV